MKEVTDDEHVHDSSKELPELVENIIKSDSMTTTTMTIIGKLFGDGAYDNNDIFRYIEDNGILPCIKVRKRMLKLDGKKGTSLETCQLYLRKKICKSGRIALAMDKDGLQKQYFLP
jgi:hypothetical protein